MHPFASSRMLRSTSSSRMTMLMIIEMRPSWAPAVMSRDAECQGDKPNSLCWPSCMQSQTASLVHAPREHHN